MPVDELLAFHGVDMEAMAVPWLSLPVELYTRGVSGGRHRSHRIRWSREFRQCLSEAQGHRCAMCQASFEGGQFSPDAPTIEHLIPLSKGGADHPDNLVMTCYRCNERRWHNQDEWWEYGTQRLDANP